MNTRKYEIIRVVAIWTILLSMHVSYGEASSVREVSMDEMLIASQFVFEGTVTAIEAREDSQKRIHTYVTIEIEDVIKGEYRNNCITLSFLGGTVGGVTLRISDMQFPQEGEHGIYFVESLERVQVNPLYGWSQGHFIVRRDDTGCDRIMTSKGLPIIAVIDEMQGERKVLNREAMPSLSRGIARELVVSKDKKALTMDEFKRILHERMEEK